MLLFASISISLVAKDAGKLKYYIMAQTDKKLWGPALTFKKISECSEQRDK